ncbi:RES family NAD+ phosphorylase [Candidatus Obscuribacterales bacterium]|nr:RES family NAD+ phosphorylase [Candidatus Obscuribacterales bacterium]
MRPEADLPAIIDALPLINYSAPCYRIVDFATLTGSMIPLYTLGPGKKGQRYTPKMGPNALYVAEDVVTAQAEYHRVLRAVLVADPTYHVIANPTVQLTIQVNLERVLDLTDKNVLTALGTTVDELTGPWRKQMIKKLFCPTQVLANTVYANGSIQAMRYPSAQGHDYSNLIIWEERVQLPSFVQVRDTTGTLSARIPPKRTYRKRTL